MELSASNIKKCFIFYQKEAFLIFQETETPKKFLILRKTETLKQFFVFHETELSYISGKRNFIICS